MQGAFNVVCVCLVLGAMKTEASQVLSAPLYLANYASSYNSHVVNHDIRYPTVAVQTPVIPNQFVAAVQTPPVVASRFAAGSPQLIPSAVPAAPVVTNQLIPSRFAAISPQLVPSAVPAAPVVTNQLVSPVVPSTIPAAPLITSQLVASRLPAVPQLIPSPVPAAPVVASRPAASLNLPVAPQVEINSRSGAQKKLSPNPPVPEQLSRSTQEPARPETNPVPNSVLAASQFLARQFSQQPNSAEAPQAKPRFFVAGNTLQNTEKLNGDDAESVEVNSAESVETPSAPNAPKLPPPAEGPKARIVFSPVSVLRTPVVPSPYNQLISF